VLGVTLSEIITDSNRLLPSLSWNQSSHLWKLNALKRFKKGKGEKSKYSFQAIPE
jgi:hypothetical protein